MIIGKYKNLEFLIWEKDGYFRWRWSHYGAEANTLGDCYAGIRRAASDWYQINGLWGFKKDPL